MNLNTYFFIKKLTHPFLVSFYVLATACSSFAQESDRLQAIFHAEYTADYLGGVPKKLVVDKQHKEIITLKSDGSMAILDEDGMLLYNMNIKKVRTFRINKNGDFYIVEGGNEIVVLNYRGEFKRKMDFSEVPDFESILVQSLHISDDGFYYIGDGKNKRVIVFDPNEKYLFHFGEGGYSKGQFMNIAAIATGPDRIYVLDPALFRVTIFDKAGKVQLTFGQISSLLGGFSMPIEMDVSGEWIYVLDANRAMVIVFDQTGEPVMEFGGIGKTSDKFDWPSDVKVDGKGRAYIADLGNRKLKVFRVITPPDTDGDGIVDYKDSCPSEKGLKENKGCLISDQEVLPDEE